MDQSKISQVIISAFANWLQMFDCSVIGGIRISSKIHRFPAPIAPTSIDLAKRGLESGSVLANSFGGLPSLPSIGTNLISKSPDIVTGFLTDCHNNLNPKRSAPTGQEKKGGGLAPHTPFKAQRLLRCVVCTTPKIGTRLYLVRA